MHPKVTAYCRRVGIRVIHMPSGATRCIGPDVDVVFAPGVEIKMAALLPYVPIKPHALRSTAWAVGRSERA